MPEIIVKLGDNVVQKYFFFQEAINVGRSQENEIVIENLAISRNHASIRFEDGHYTVCDLDSSNGTFVNGVRIKKTEIMDKDVITVGKHKLYFYDQKSAPEVVRQPSLQDGDSTMLVDATPPALEAVLIVGKGRQKDQRFVLGPGTTRLGRGPENEIRLTDWFVSKQHAQIDQIEGGYVVRDLGSWRHTFVNGETVEEAPLRNGDVLQLGPTVEMRFELSEASAGARQIPRIPAELDEPAPVAAPARDERAEAEEDDPFSTSHLPMDNFHPHLEPPNMDQGEASDGGTGEMPLDAVASDAAADEAGCGNPFDELLEDEANGNGAEHDSATRRDVNPFDEFFSEQAEAGEPAAEAEASGEPAEEIAWESGPDLPGDAFAADAEDDAGFEAAGSEAPGAEPHTEAVREEAAAAGAELLLTEEPEAPADPADELYEDMAEVSLLAAADAATTENAPAAGEKVDRSPAGSDDGTEAAAAQPDDEVAMWERALENKSLAIRRQAARRLKQLTGKDYEY